MSYIQFEEKNGIGIVQFDRPEAMNALSSEGIREALRFFEGLGDPELTAILLTGSGKGLHFGCRCTGNSRDGAQGSLPFQRSWQSTHVSDRGLPSARNRRCQRLRDWRRAGGRPCHRLHLRLCQRENGIAGSHAGDNARFRRGAPPLRSNRDGAGQGADVSGRFVTAQEALDLGIVNRVVLSGELMVQSMQTAALIGEAGPRAIRAAKRHANACMLVEAAQGAAKEAESFGGLFGDDESREGLLAFLEKRKPAWAKEGGQT